VSNVEQLFSSAKTIPDKDPRNLIKSIRLPDGLNDLTALDRALDAEDLNSSKRAVFMGFPSLRITADKLLEQITVGWPSQTGKYSAAVTAILNALKAVENGMGQGEDSRQAVIANFMRGLSSVADDVAHIDVWGVSNNRSIEQWNPAGDSFRIWATDSKFDELRFYQKPIVSLNEVEGTRLKIMCSVANARDVGAMARFK
jgi:hypothetical protein